MASLPAAVAKSNGRCLRKFHAIDCQALIGYRFLSPFPKDDSGIHRLLLDFYGGNKLYAIPQEVTHVLSTVTT